MLKQDGNDVFIFFNNESRFIFPSWQWSHEAIDKLQLHNSYIHHFISYAYNILIYDKNIVLQSVYTSWHCIELTLFFRLIPQQTNVINNLFSGCFKPPGQYLGLLYPPGTYITISWIALSSRSTYNNILSCYNPQDYIHQCLGLLHPLRLHLYPSWAAIFPQGLPQTISWASINP